MKNSEQPKPTCDEYSESLSLFLHWAGLLNLLEHLTDVHVVLALLIRCTCSTSHAY